MASGENDGPVPCTVKSQHRISPIIESELQNHGWTRNMWGLQKTEISLFAVLASRSLRTPGWLFRTATPESVLPVRWTPVKAAG